MSVSLPIRGAAPVVLTNPRFYASHLKRRVKAAFAPRPGTRSADLVATTPDGSTLRLRKPSLADSSDWRRSRIRNRASMERYWPTSDVSWTERHSDQEWVHECKMWQHRARSGDALPGIVEVDGRFAGQCNLEWIDGFNRTAEVGFWIDRDFEGRHLSTVAVGLVLEYGFGSLGLQRISAPVHVDNVAAQRTCEASGMMREGLMREYSETDGVRGDHILYAVTADRYHAVVGPRRQ